MNEIPPTARAHRAAKKSIAGRLSVRGISAGLGTAVPAAVAGAVVHASTGAVVLTTAGVALLAAFVRELPGLYWMSRYNRLVTKGAALAATVDDVQRLITALAAAQQSLPTAAGGTPQADPQQQPGE